MYTCDAHKCNEDKNKYKFKKMLPTYTHTYTNTY